jgi:hypothetical protein
MTFATEVSPTKEDPDCYRAQIGKLFALDGSRRQRNRLKGNLNAEIAHEDALLSSILPWLLFHRDDRGLIKNYCRWLLP